VWVSQTVTDADGDTVTVGSSAASALAISFKDDGPSLIVEDSMTYNMKDVDHPSSYPAIGHYTYSSGADTANFASAFGSTALQWKNSTGNYVNLILSSSDTTFKTWQPADGTFSITLKSNGTYEFDLLKPLAAPTPIDSGSNLLAGISGGSGLAFYDLPSTLFGGHSLSDSTVVLTTIKPNLGLMAR